MKKKKCRCRPNYLCNACLDARIDAAVEDGTYVVDLTEPKEKK